MTALNHITPAAAGPRTLHAICELARLAVCDYCQANGLHMPCVSTGAGPDGYHVARFAAARRRGLISDLDFLAVLEETAGVFTSATVIYDQRLGGLR